METEDKVITGLVILAAGYFLFNKLQNPEPVTNQEAQAYTVNAANNGGNQTFWAPLQNKQAIEVDTPSGNTTYFLGPEDYDNMTRWQRLLLSWGVSPKTIFG